MAKTTTVRLHDDVIEKINGIKEAKKLVSFNDAVKSLLPKGLSIDEEIIEEKPAFTLVGETVNQNLRSNIVPVTWNNLKKASSGDSWVALKNSSKETATVLFKDKDGVFIRFTHENTDYNSKYCEEKEVGVKYFNFF